jgi:RNA polymerase sigma factor (TIGR02999 family)
MTMQKRGGVTQLLADWRRGDSAALEQLMPIVYDELHRIAVAYLSRERFNHTLQATALVHEAYLQLVDERQVDWQNRAHFFGAAARLMRRILVDYARARNAAKRGGGDYRMTLSEPQGGYELPDVDVILLDAALNELEVLDRQQSRVIELKFFGGLSIEETAEVLAISTATVKRDWLMAKLWLRRRMKGESQR